MYLVIEVWPEHSTTFILADPDTGEDIIFPTRQEAETAAKECQNGIVFEL
jgi:hypothetical protein